MKKSIGLIADISSFNTTLPQTRHLNYFMGTNPRRYANGGDVSQGIPNYPNPNITNGFLPMALGFSKAGEVKKDDVLIIEFLKRNGALSENATKEEIEKFLAEINANEGLKEQIIEAQILNREQDATNKDKTVKSTDTEKDPFDPNRLGLGDEFVNQSNQKQTEIANKRVTPEDPFDPNRLGLGDEFVNQPIQKQTEIDNLEDVQKEGILSLPEVSNESVTKENNTAKKFIETEEDKKIVNTETDSEIPIEKSVFRDWVDFFSVIGGDINHLIKKLKDTGLVNKQGEKLNNTEIKKLVKEIADASNEVTTPKNTAISIPSETQRIKYENMPSEPIYKDGTDVFDKKRLNEIENVFDPNRISFDDTPSLTKNEAYRITQPGGYHGAPPANSQATSGIGPRLLMPTDTVTTTPSDRQGAFDNVPLKPLPKISIEQRQRDSEDKQRAPDTIPGITSIIPSDRQEGIGIANKMKPKSTNPFDVNGDGMVTFADLAEAIRLGMGTKFIQELRQFLEGFKGEKKPDEGEKIVPEGPDVDKEKEIKESEEQEDNKKIKPKIKPKPDEPIIQDGGITGIGSGRASDLGGYLETSRRKYDILGKKEQGLIKKLASLTDGGGIKSKKDVPAWALPMMSAGFAMMASKSPYFMQALGEGGQKGLETFTAQKTAEEDKLDKEATRDQSRAMAAYYRGEGKQSAGTMKIMNGVYHRFNNKTGTFDPVYLKDGVTPAKVTVNRQDAFDYLQKNDTLWNSYDYDTREQKIKEYIDMINGTYEQIIKKKEAEGGGGFSIFDIPNKFGDFLEGFQNAKDGGIVSIRR